MKEMRQTSEKSISDIDKKSWRDNFGIVGQSRAIKEVISKIRILAPKNINVLILGETGSGKDLVAEAMHYASGRKGNFVPINCGCMSIEFFESELFGHEKGAFTGAGRQRKGKTRTAEGGTLFLDEIGDLPLDIQVKLLRFIEGRKKEISPLGSDNVHYVNVRIITASNKNLKDLVREGKFREDLYYRLNNFVIEVPSLAERQEDIPLLVEYFFRFYCEIHNEPAGNFTNLCVKKFLEANQGKKWPGNIREISSAVENAVILKESSKFFGEEFVFEESDEPEQDIIVLPYLDTESDEECTGRDFFSNHWISSFRGLTYKESLAKLKKELLRLALYDNNANIKKTCEALAMHRGTFNRIRDEAGIDIEEIYKILEK